MESTLYNLNSSISFDDEMDTTQMLMHQNFPEFSAPQGNNSEINFHPRKFPEATTTNSTSTTTPMSLPNSIVNVNTPSSMPWSTTISFSNNNNVTPNVLNSALSEKSNDSMREMVFRIASMQPIQQIEAECVKAPKRRNVKISKDPQSVAARHRRERISERIRILQRLVPGGTKMDTASVLEEAIHYLKFLKSQVQSLEQVANTNYYRLGFPVSMCSGNATSSNVTATSYFSLPKPYHDSQIQSAERFKDA